MKQNWLPKKNKNEKKCPKCKGKGQFEYFAGGISPKFMDTCNQCGGKGFTN